MFNSHGVGKIGNKLYYSGGYDYGTGTRVITGTTWAYDTRTDLLTRKADMPKVTADGVTGVIDGKLYVLPGTCSGDGWPNPGYCETEPIRQLYRYDPGTNTWLARRSAPHYHKSGAGGVINGKFYVVGGFNASGQPVAALDVYDPATNTWQTLAPIPTAGGARAAVIQGKLFVISWGTGTTLHAYAYNPATNTWKSRAAPSSVFGAVVKVTLHGLPYLVSVGSSSTELYKP